MRKILEFITDALEGDALEWVYFGLAPLPPVWVLVPVSMLNVTCGIYGASEPKVHACAFRDYGKNECTVIAPYTRADAPAWIVHHEEKHCAGWNHK